MATPTTPKFKSGEFKDALAAVKSVFDAHALCIVLLDALERKSAEQIFARFSRGAAAGRLAGMQKMELVGPLTALFFDNEEAAYQVMKELDRACQKERHIVSSIPEAQAPERVGSYRAIALKRERAKFVWALARDERASVRDLAGRIINEFFREVADVERARAITRGDSDVGPSLKDDVELARRIQGQAQQLAEASRDLVDLESKAHRLEEERARLLAEMGAKERSSKQANEARDELEQELKTLRAQLAMVEDKQREAEAARASEREARAMAEDLQQKVRRLEKLAGAAETLTEVQAQLETANHRIEELTRQAARTDQAYKRERAEVDKDRARLRTELDAAREELHKARKRIAELEEAGSRPAVERPPPATPEDERVLVLLDQANLAGTAHQVFDRKVSFTGVLDQLRAGKKHVRAIAFVVDNGGTAFDAFCDTLRRSGWELRIKRSKRFSDGRSKADWDMGIAMAAIDLAPEADVVILGSGDGDFAPLVERLKKDKKRVEVVTFAEGLAGELAAVADRVIRLDSRALE